MAARSGDAESGIYSVLSVLIASTGVSLVFKDYLVSLPGAIILRRIRQVKLGGRINVLITPAIPIKGDVIPVGAMRTSLHEVGDGERLPSVRTGRLVKVPNFTLVNSPLVIYGEQITDEVIAYESPLFSHLDTIEEDMRTAICQEGHEIIEVGLYRPFSTQLPGAPAKYGPRQRRRAGRDRFLVQRRPPGPGRCTPIANTARRSSSGTSAGKIGRSSTRSTTSRVFPW